MGIWAILTVHVVFQMNRTQVAVRGLASAVHLVTL